MYAGRRAVCRQRIHMKKSWWWMERSRTLPIAPATGGCSDKSKSKLCMEESQSGAGTLLNFQRSFYEDEGPGLLGMHALEAACCTGTIHGPCEQSLRQRWKGWGEDAQVGEWFP